MKTEDAIALSVSPKDSVANGNDDMHKDKMAALVQNSVSETNFRENPRNSEERDFKRAVCSSGESLGKEIPDAAGGSGKVEFEDKRRFESVHPKSKLATPNPRNLSADLKTRFKSVDYLTVPTGRRDVTSAAEGTRCAPPTSQQRMQPDRSRSRRPESPRSRSRSVDAVKQKSPVRSGPGSVCTSVLPGSARESSEFGYKKISRIQ